MKKILFVIPALMFLAFGCNKTQPVKVEDAPKPVKVESQVYETDYLKITVPVGWTAKQANQTYYDGTCITKDNCTSVKKSAPNPAAVNITKGNFILYINTQDQQASGVEGGRFAEIGMGAPSVDAVVTEQPSSPCGTLESHSAYSDRVRADLYVNNQEKNSYCMSPKNGSTVWYFSYITGPKDGYFNYYVPGTGKGYVITMAYTSKDVNTLPVKGSIELKTALDEMTGILKTLEIKRVYTNEKYGFQIGYPTDWIVSDNAAIVFRSIAFQSLINANTKNCTDKDPKTNCISEPYGEQVSFSAELGDRDPSKLKGSQTFNGTKFSKYIEVGLFGDYTTYVALHNGINYAFTADEKNVQYLEKMLQTFKFTK